MHPAIVRESSAPARRQRGATLIMGLIMLVLLTLMGLASINSATSNLKVVGNMQFQQEALAAAQVAVNQVLSSGGYFSDPSTSPTNTTVDMNGDGTADYTVNLSQPCIVQTKDILQGVGTELSPTNAEDLKCISSSVLRNPGIMGQSAGATKSDCAWVTWRVTASVNDAGTKANVSLIQAARQRMDRILADAYKADPAKRCL